MEYPRYYREKLSLVIPSGSQSASATIPMEGEIQQVHFRVPNFSASGTIKLAVVDSEGFEIWSKASIAKNTNTNIYVDVSAGVALPANDKMSAVVTASPSGGLVDSLAHRTMVAIFYIEGNKYD